MEQSDWFSDQSESCSPDRVTGPLKKKKSNIFFTAIINKHLINRACLVWIGGYWFHTFFAFLWTSPATQSIQKVLIQYPPI
jgi:hypothetical protein